MIKYVQGDILLSTASAIAHGVAPEDDFKQGLALSMREQWPAMYKDFRHYCKINHPKPGGLWSWKTANSPIVINLLTQEAPKSAGIHPGKASLSNVNHSLKALEKEIKKENIKSLAITRLATGVGGLDWDEVKPELEKHLSQFDIPVYVYEEFHKGQKAIEG